MVQKLTLENLVKISQQEINSQFQEITGSSLQSILSFTFTVTFTNYNSFNSPSNAVTPRPNRPASYANVPISATSPLNESSLGAVDLNLWKNIGKELMVKSNINDGIVCQPNSGSLVTKKDGSMSCRNIKNVATACSGLAP
jgi:hypothetical protein